MSTRSSRIFPVTRRGFCISAAAAFVTPRAIADTPTCSLAAEQEVGPYYIDYGKLRADVTEGKPGVPLKLRIALVDARSCAPLPNAAVDIWHCDASGLYSGFTANNPGGPGRGMPRSPRREFFSEHAGPPPARITDESRFLRGLQITGPPGFVEFTTIYPGWYAGRTIHIHLKVHCGGAAEEVAYRGGHVSHAGQLFFPEEITEEVARLEPYARRLAIHRTTQTEDGVFNGQHGALSMLRLSRLQSGSNAEGFLALATLAVDPQATPASR